MLGLKTSPIPAFNRLPAKYFIQREKMWKKMPTNKKNVSALAKL